MVRVNIAVTVRSTTPLAGCCGSLCPSPVRLIEILIRSVLLVPRSGERVWYIAGPAATASSVATRLDTRYPSPMGYNDVYHLNYMS